MTDNEIIKALEWCSTQDHCNTGVCPIYLDMGDDEDCATKISQLALDLINRQKAEIERLTNSLSTFKSCYESLTDMYENAKSEAIKEFAERLKEKKLNIEIMRMPFLDRDIDSLVKEMVGE